MGSALERRLYLPYTAEQLFDLVADIEHYPQFVPGWREAVVSGRRDSGLLVDQVVRLGPMEWRFRSEAKLDRPHAIRIRTVEGPFGDLSIVWTFETLGDEGCAVIFRADHDPRRLGDRIVRRYFERSMLSVVDAFEERARGLYGL